MRPTMSLVFLLFFCVPLLVDKSQGIRLDDSFVFEKIVHKESFEGGKEAAVGASCKGGGVCSGTMMERRSFRAIKAVHHSLPGFHEDYYGPRNHKPKHH